MTPYHVTLGGQGYLVDLRGYRRRAHTPFAPKTARGDRSYGDLVHDQAYQVSDWRGGEGFLQADPEHPERWRAGSGVDVFSEPGALRLGPRLVTVATTALDELTVAQVYQGLLYVGASNGDVYRWDGASWSLSLATGKAGGIRSLAVYRGKLYAGNGGDGAVAELSGGTWTNPRFTISGAAGVRTMATFYRQTAQYLYLAATGGTHGSVYWWDGATLSTKQYDFEEPRPEVSLVLGNRLYFFVADPAGRRGAVYSVDDSGGGGTYRAHVGLAEAYPTVGTVWDGTAYLGTGLDGGIYSWDGTALRLARQLAGAGAPYGGELRGMAVWNGALWVSVADGAGGIGLLRHDGAGGGWSRPVAGLAGTSPRGLAVYNGQLYPLTHKAGQAQISRTDGTYRASGQLETGLFDARLPGVDKVPLAVTLVHAPLGTGQSIEVQYRLEDAGPWASLGASATPGATSATFDVPGAVTCKQIAIRLLLAGPAGAGSSPAVYDWLLRYALAPEPKREWELSVVLEGTAELPLVRLDGTPEPLSGVALSEALWALKGRPGPTTLVDLDGAGRSVWITDLQEEVVEAHRLGYRTVGKLWLLEA